MDGTTRIVTILAALFGTAALAAAAHADPLSMQADGWVTENGRILRPGEAQPTTFAVHPATRADWIAECDSRLAAANPIHEPPISYENSCRAWLDYFENSGAADHGYGFAYAIPVAISLVAARCDCAPVGVSGVAVPGEARHRSAHRTILHDKRVRIRRD